MLEQRIQQQFFESADLQNQAAEPLSRPVADAVQAIVAGLTAGGRVFSAGLGASTGLARLFAHDLLGRFERERPGLAAWALGQDAGAASGSAAEGRFEQLFARQIDTLGQPGDLLLLIDTDGEHPALRLAAKAAQAKDMTVIALTGRSAGALGATLGETDVLVAVPHDRAPRVREVQLLVLHCLCDAIDLQLLGEQDPE